MNLNIYNILLKKCFNDAIKNTLTQKDNMITKLHMDRGDNMKKTRKPRRI